jgi:hypothetical protein
MKRDHINVISPATEVHIWDFKDGFVAVKLMTLMTWKHKIKLEIALEDYNGDAITAALKALSAPEDYPRDQLLRHIADSYDSVMDQYAGRVEPILTERVVTNVTGVKGALLP